MDIEINRFHQKTHQILILALHENVNGTFDTLLGDVELIRYVFSRWHFILKINIF